MAKILSVCYVEPIFGICLVLSVFLIAGAAKTVQGIALSFSNILCQFQNFPAFHHIDTNEY